MGAIEYLRDLLTQKQNGVLDTEDKIQSEDCILWRNLISYKVLEANVCHVDEEIRLASVMLLVESRKSTLKFTKEELGIITRFLEYNLKERPEYIPVMKKALKRLKDSLTVMHRQLIQEAKARDYYKENNKTCMMSNSELEASYQTSIRIEADINVYKDFYIAVKNMCISRISPDATYHSRRASLQLLCLLYDFLNDEFKDIEWNSDEAQQVFKCLLLETYECNKAMAFTIIKSFDVTLLGLNREERIYDLLTVAIQLGNSIRPIDSVTAAYVLKVSMLSPVIQTVLESKFHLNQPACDTVEAVTMKLVFILLTKLEESLTAAKKSILLAVTKYSLYGYVYCLRTLLNECNLKDAAKENLWQDTVARVISTCFELNQVVSPIVNNSSPEGHLPMDLDIRTTKNIFSSSHEELVTPQMVLLCSWRTVKEVSLLFGLLATKSPIYDDNSSVGLLTEEQVVKIGEHLVTLLMETKHRGAFEQAHVGFSLLCSRLWRLINSNLKNLPILWLHQILIAITGFAQKNTKLCATRRSAGIPFMVQALLSTEPRSRKNTKSSTFHSVMKILLGFAEFENNVNLFEKVKRLIYKDSVFSDYETSFESFKCNSGENCTFGSKTQVTEVKTHALNILRAIFRHSQLGELVNDYIADGLIAAFRSYDGMTWAERNAATLLFSALIIRIFGVQRTKDHVNLTTDNKMSAKVFFERYPDLLPFILGELSKFLRADLKRDSMVQSNVHPILLLLSRLYVNRGAESVNGDWREMICLISKCASSSVHETRKLAARALVPLLTEEIITDIAKSLLHNVISAQNWHSSLNLVHGYMLQILELTKQSNFLKPKLETTDWNEFLKETKWILKNLESDSPNATCFSLATIYIHVFHEISKTNDETNLDLNDMLDTILKHVEQPGVLKDGPAREYYKTSAIGFLLYLWKKSPSEAKSGVTLDTLIKLYLHILNATDLESKLVAWTTIIEIIDDVNRTDKHLHARAIEAIRSSVDNLHKYSPDLQDAIFNFLYHSVSRDDIQVAELVLNKIRVDRNKSSYCERDSYLLLLGQSYVISKRQSPSNAMSECKNEVYDNFCDFFWISSTSGSLRSSVFNTFLEMRSITEDGRDSDHQKMVWWTTLLQLLVDDNYEIRRKVSELICQISGNASPVCFTGMLRIFFNMFSHVARKNPAVGYSLLFTWSFSLFGDNDFEMDDTDVFNKCRNYDMYEPVQISIFCANHAKTLLKQGSIDEPLPVDCTDWINSQLNVDFPQCTSFRKLVQEYGSCVPVLEGKVSDILNPTYKDKLLQALAYEKWSAVIRE